MRWGHFWTRIGAGIRSTIDISAAALTA